MRTKLWDSSRIKQLFSALSNSKRLAILTLLLENDAMRAEAVALKLKFPYKTAVRHLDALRKCGLISVKHDTNSLLFSLNADCKDNLILLSLALVNMAYIDALKEDAKANLSEKAKGKIDEYLRMSFRPTLANILKFFGQNY